MSEGEEQSLSEKKIDRWGYDDYFREYLLLIGRKGLEALDSIDKYPASIELSPVWHETLEQIREDTKKDGRERLAIIGFKGDRTLSLPRIAPAGTKMDIPRDVFEEEFERAKDKHGVESMVGEIHSHPDNSPFSPEDLLRLLYEPPELTMAKYFTNDRRGNLPTIGIVRYVSGLATAEENIFAFKTRETFPIGPFDFWPKSPQEVFLNYWYEKSGIEYHKENGKRWGRLLHNTPNPWNVSFGVAKAHNLALYKGLPNTELKRIYPE